MQVIFVKTMTAKWFCRLRRAIAKLKQNLFEKFKGGIEIMNKNFKRVISTVAALAMAASSFVAMAATYPDVTADSKYYSAIEQLSAMGIIDGFDDGTFKPDEKVTRAQMAKLVIGAKNLLADAEGNTRVIFDDVAAGKSEWAIGYVAEAYEEEIINGTSDTTFDPDATVTYMQAMKMLVNAAGYESWAQDEGGWPEGYRYWGRDLEIGKGISGVNDDTEMTRGQIAQMIANAMNAPKLELTGYDRDNGEKYAVYTQMDGKGEGFKSLLTEDWQTYPVYGRVMATSREGGALKGGQVAFDVEKTDRYVDTEVPYSTIDVINGKEVITNHGVVEVKKAEAEGTGAEDMLLEYAYALINVNDDDEAKILYIESAGKNKTVEFDSKLVNVASDANTVYVHKNENTTATAKYALRNAEVIVNGVKFDNYQKQSDKDLNGDKVVDSKDFTGEAGMVDVMDVVGKYAQGTITLVDTPTAGETSTDGKYEYILINSESTAIVSDVVVKEATDTIKINFEDATVGKNITIDTAADDVVYNFVDTNGAEVDPATIAADSVLSIAYDVNGTFEGSAFYSVVVSTDKVEGRVSSSYYDDLAKKTVYVINGTEYTIADGMSASLAAGNKTYEALLDKNGEIVKSKTLASSVNYAIVDRFYDDAKLGELTVTLVLKDGTKETYPVRDAAEAKATDAYKAIGENIVPLNDSSFAKAADRMVQYTVNKNGEVTLEKATATYVPNAEYSDVTGRVGSYAFATDAIILDAGAFAIDRTQSVSVSSLDNLVNEEKYDVIVVGDFDVSTGAYPMLVIVESNMQFTANSRMVVAAGAISTTEVDGVQVHELKVATPNGEATLQDEVAGSVIGSIAEGDAFIYYLDSDGYVADVIVIGDETTTTIGEIVIDTDSKTPGNQEITGKDGAVEFYCYPVMTKYDSSIGVATSTTAKVEGDKFLKFSVDAAAYMYDCSVMRNHVEKLSSIAGIAKSRIANSAYTDATKTTVDLTDGENEINYVIVRVYDDDVQEVYSIAK